MTTLKDSPSVAGILANSLKDCFVNEFEVLTYATRKFTGWQPVGQEILKMHVEDAASLMMVHLQMYLPS